MAAYVVLNIDVTDPARYADYAKAAARPSSNSAAGIWCAAAGPKRSKDR